MAALIVVLLRVTDRDRFAQYGAQVGATLKPFNGQLVAAEDPAEVLEGEPPYPRVVVLRFRSKDDARAWMASPAYKKAEIDRQAGSESVFYLLDERPPG